MKNLNRIVDGFLLLVIVFGMTACVKHYKDREPFILSISTPYTIANNQPLTTPFLPPPRLPDDPFLSPTPDVPRIIPTLRTQSESYIVQPNDSLSAIARGFGVDLNQLIAANQIANDNYLEVGQVLEIPAADPTLQPSRFKIIPDSELVNSPSSIGFDIETFLKGFSGYLSTMENSAEVVQQAAEDYSVNPRILLTLLEYRTGWLSGPNTTQTKETPTPKDAWKTNLFSVLSTYANNLNRGYYLWKFNQLGYFVLSDGGYVPAAESINAATAGVQYWASAFYGKQDWQYAVSEDGIFNLYQRFFGYPFDYSVEPLIPPGLQQPQLLLPFQSNVAWSFTGGPHSSWSDGTPWGALDFAPPGSPMGCSVSGDWVTAVADGLILRSEFGEVIQDLDGDGYEQTGWVILYMHIDTWERVQPGDYVHAGELIGHTSCEGGVSSGSHLHLARRYNGEWIDADDAIPFVLSGYTAVSSGSIYDGYLVKNGVSIEAWDRFRTESLVQR